MNLRRFYQDDDEAQYDDEEVRPGPYDHEAELARVQDLIDRIEARNSGFDFSTGKFRFSGSEIIPDSRRPRDWCEEFDSLMLGQETQWMWLLHHQSHALSTFDD